MAFNQFKTKYLLAPVALTFLGFVLSVAAEPVINVEPENNSLTTVVLASNQSLLISLLANPSTGFRWGIKNRSELSRCLVIDEQTFQPSNSGKVGTAGKQVWLLQQKCHELKVQVLKFEYRRPWEAQQDAATWVDLNVKFKP